MTVGPAAGHFEEIKGKRYQNAADDDTLQIIAKLAEDKPHGIPFRCNLTTMDHQKGPIVGRVLPGTLRIVDGSIRGDIELETEYADWKHIANLARTQPTNVGISFEFEYFAQLSGDSALFRPTDLICATLVDRPAANPNGLLAEQTNNTQEQDMDEEKVKAICAEVMAPMVEQMSKLATLVESMAPAPEAKKEEEPAMAAMSKKIDQLTDAVAKTAELIKATTGNPAASLQAKPASAETKHAYLQRVEAIEKTEGKSRAAALSIAVARFPKEYNDWMTKGAPTS